jgi:hypothetical protein
MSLLVVSKWAVRVEMAVETTFVSLSVVTLF